MTVSVGATIPTYLTVDPNTGLVGADFTGVVKALGFYIPESSVQVTNQNAIIWTRSDQPNPIVLTNPPPSAIYAEEINYQFDDGTQLPGDMLRVEVDATNTPSWQALIAAIELVSTGYGGTFSKLEVRADDQAGTAKSRVWAEASNATATIIDGTGASSFLQLLSTQKLQLAFGTAVITWFGGEPFSNPLAIPHGLGRTPVAYTVMANGTTSQTALNFIVYGTNKGSGQSVSVDANNLYVKAWSWQGNPNNGETSNVLWMAIG